MSIKKSCIWLPAFLFLISSIMSGCSSFFSMGYEKCYQGWQKPLSDIAIVVPISDWDYSISTSSWINYIDGVKAKTDVRLGITFPSVRELTPGNHIICTRYQKKLRSYGYSMSMGCSKINLNAQPGQVYFIYPLINTHNTTWQPAYWNITGDIHTAELKGLVEKIDKTLAENRSGQPVSILSLATKQNNSPLLGFGEKHKSNLKRWLKKNITVSYEFNRYKPNIVAEADNGVEYHLKLDQRTGHVSNVFGKNVDVGRGSFPTFQSLNSKYAHKYINRTKSEIASVWEEQKDGSYIKIKSLSSARCGDNYYISLLDTKTKDQVGKEAIKALVLTMNANINTLRSDITFKKKIRGKSNQEANQLLELEILSMKKEIERLLLIAQNKAKTNSDKNNLSKVVKQINDLLSTP